MPNRNVRRLTALYRDGLEVYPPGMRGLAATGVDARRAPPAFVKPAAARKFLDWIRASHPKLYADAVRRQSGKTLGAVEAKAADSTGDGPLDRILSTIQTLAPTYLQARAQKELLDVQLDRMRQGLAPLSATQYMPGVQLSVDPSMYAPQFETMKPWLIYGGLGLAALYLVSQLRRR